MPGTTHRSSQLPREPKTGSTEKEQEKTDELKCSAGNTSDSLDRLRYCTVNMTISTLLVDLDGTLYDITNGYEEHVRQDSQSVFICYDSTP